MEPSGRNQWQPEHPQKPLKQADPQPLATDGKRFGAHGKEEVAEGVGEAPYAEAASSASPSRTYRVAPRPR